MKSLNQLFTKSKLWLLICLCLGWVVSFIMANNYVNYINELYPVGFELKPPNLECACFPGRNKLYETLIVWLGYSAGASGLVLVFYSLISKFNQLTWLKTILLSLLLGLSLGLLLAVFLGYGNYFCGGHDYYKDFDPQTPSNYLWDEVISRSLSIGLVLSVLVTIPSFVTLTIIRFVISRFLATPKSKVSIKTNKTNN